MDHWEAILKLYDYDPNVDRYKCQVCGGLYKTDGGIYRHIGNNHQDNILTLREQAIK